MSQRDALLAAAESLLWERGFEAMSPKAIQRASGAGQGSMYHHFDGKRDLARQAIERHEKFLRAAARAMLDRQAPPLEQVFGWLRAERDALSGCRLGRLANERSIRTDDELRAPLERYFAELTTLVTDRLRAAHADGQLAVEVDPEALASMLVAVVQGGYVLALATQDPAHLERATEAACEILSPSR